MPSLIKISQELFEIIDTVKRVFFAGCFFFAVFGVFAFRGSLFSRFAGLLHGLHTLKGQSSTEKQ